MKKFHLQIERRFSSIIVTINEDDFSTGSLLLSPEDEDLIPHIQTMIDGFNLKYTEKPPQTKTGGNVFSGGSISGKSAK